ncbi:hypothetical protein GCM10025772_22900 [Ferrimonas gelatinilytica]|uniref:Uncharacterized protein n=1 Tax=Ferrimonas gelatinilytica TaxID=1255257 RepID=A0ABP9SAB4_9GAMM
MGTLLAVGIADEVHTVCAKLAREDLAHLPLTRPHRQTPNNDALSHRGSEHKGRATTGYCGMEFT